MPQNFKTALGCERLHPHLTNYVGYCLSKIALRLRSNFDARIQQFGLVAPQYAMMLVLKIDGAMTQIELGSYMAIDKATMVRLIDGLEEQGYVQRSQHATDRRAKMLEVTPKGRQICAKLEKQRIEAEDEFLKPLAPAEQAALREIVKKLIQAG